MKIFANVGHAFVHLQCVNVHTCTHESLLYKNVKQKNIAAENVIETMSLFIFLSFNMK